MLAGRLNQAEDLRANGEVRGELAPVNDSVIVLEEIHLEDLEPVQFGEEVSRRLHGVRKRELGIPCDLPVQNGLCGRKLEVVHPHKGLSHRSVGFDPGILRAEAGAASQEQDKRPQM